MLVGKVLRFFVGKAGGTLVRTTRHSEPGEANGGTATTQLIPQSKLQSMSTKDLAVRTRKILTAKDLQLT